MIDNLALALTHGLILVALLRILMRDELDREGPAEGKDEATEPRTRREARRARRQREDGPNA